MKLRKWATLSNKQRVPHLLLPAVPPQQLPRLYSTRVASDKQDFGASPQKPKLTHLTTSGNAQMVSISEKKPTQRTATAVCSVHFSNSSVLPLIQENRARKGDVLGVARVAGIMAAKRTSDLIPLCHPIAITHVSVDLEVTRTPKRLSASPYPETSREEASLKSTHVSLPWAGSGQGDAYKISTSQISMPVNGPRPFGQVNITATVSCDGKTGVEMEALTAASVAAMTVYDMCKAVDKGMRIDSLRVTRKEGGKSGTWEEGRQADSPE